jgi:hypothetical protein
MGTFAHTEWILAQLINLILLTMVIGFVRLGMHLRGFDRQMLALRGTARCDMVI